MRLDWEPLREPALDHGSGQTRMPPQERRHEGLGERRHEEVLVWGILLRLDWEPLREGRLKVARGRSWQPEIGMEHASRGRRSGNKGVGARWRGRFRIFSARHRSRTKVSHAENSGMTMLFFSWGLLRCRACVDHGSGHSAPCHLRRDGTRGGGFCFFYPPRGAGREILNFISPAKMRYFPTLAEIPCRPHSDQAH